MIDYFAHAAAKAVWKVFSALAAGDPGLQAQKDGMLNDAQAEPDAALLGILIDQVIAHAASDGRELDLLEKAAALWGKGRTVFDRIGEVRTAVEGALAAPEVPGALDEVNAVKAALAVVAASRKTLVDDLTALRDEIGRMLHIPAHPWQSDVPAEDWDWENIFAGRRTDAFVRAAFKRGRTSRNAAFAFGALCSYAGNTAGSPDGQEHVTQPIEGIIPAAAPDHLCLIAMVAGFTDQPAKDPARFMVRAMPVPQRALAALRIPVHAEPFPADGLELGLEVADGG